MECLANAKYADGIYRQEFDIKSGIKAQFIKRVEGDSCENCVFNCIPCLSIKSHYGCYKTPEYSPNNETINGELVKSGHFVKIDYSEAVLGYKENKML